MENLSTVDNANGPSVSTIESSYFIFHAEHEFMQEIDHRSKEYIDTMVSSQYRKYKLFVRETPIPVTTSIHRFINFVNAIMI